MTSIKASVVAKWRSRSFLFLGTCIFAEEHMDMRALPSVPKTSCKSKSSASGSVLMASGFY